MSDKKIETACDNIMDAVREEFDELPELSQQLLILDKLAIEIKAIRDELQEDLDSGITREFEDDDEEEDDEEFEDEDEDAEDDDEDDDLGEEDDEKVKPDTPGTPDPPGPGKDKKKSK